VVEGLITDHQGELELLASNLEMEFGHRPMFNIQSDRDVLIEFLTMHAPDRIGDVDTLMMLPIDDLTLSMKLNYGHRIHFGQQQKAEHAAKKREFQAGGVEKAKELLRTYGNCCRPIKGNLLESRETPAKILAALSGKDAQGDLKRLLGTGIDINAPNKEGLTGMMLVCVRFRYPVLDLLLKYGANVNERPKMEKTGWEMTLAKKEVLTALEVKDKYKEMSGRATTLQWLDEHGAATGSVCDEKLVEATDIIAKVVEESKHHERVHVLEKFFDPAMVPQLGIGVGGDDGLSAGMESDTESESDSESESDFESSSSGSGGDSESESEVDEQSGWRAKAERQIAKQERRLEREEMQNAQANQNALMAQFATMQDGPESQLIQRLTQLFLSLDMSAPNQLATGSNIMHIFALCSQDRGCREVMSRIGTVEALLTSMRLSLTSRTPKKFLEGAAELVNWMAKETNHKAYGSKIAKNAEALVLMLDR
jgi:hypothetical protein